MKLISPSSHKWVLAEWYVIIWPLYHKYFLKCLSFMSDVLIRHTDLMLSFWNKIVKNIEILTWLTSCSICRLFRFRFGIWTSSSSLWGFLQIYKNTKQSLILQNVLWLYSLEKETTWHINLWSWVGRWLVGWLVHWLIGWLIDWLLWLAGWLIDLLVVWLIDWMIGLLINWLIYWVDGWLIGWLSGWLIGLWLIDWLIGWNVCCLIDWLVY